MAFDPADFASLAGNGALPGWLANLGLGLNGPPGGQQGFPAAPPPDPAALPANAAPTVGGPAQPQQGAPAMPTSDQAPPAAASPSILDRLGSGVIGFLNSPTPMGALGNLIGGVTSGHRTDVQGQKEEERQKGNAATYKSLVDKGVDPKEALAAVYNPDAMSLLQERLKPRPLVNYEGQLRNPVTNELIGNVPSKIETIEDPQTGMKISVMRDAAGQLRRVDPRNLPRAGGGPQPVQVRSYDEAMKLPPGTPFIDPFGTPRVR